jgi:excisionase family DNA binding protein
MAEDFPEMMTIAEAGRFLRLHPQSIYRRIKSGTLPALRVGHSWRIPQSLLRELALANLRYTR